MILIFVKKSRTALAALLLVALAACGGGDGSSDDRVLVVATTSVLGDVVSEVVGDAADVEVLVPIGADPHDFEASPADVARLRDADLVVITGLELEHELEDVLEAAEADGVRVVEVAPQLDPIPFGASDDFDPHFWLDPLRVARAAEVIAAELGTVVSGEWDDRAAAYGTRLAALDRDIADRVSVLPEGRRVLVTNHDSLGYFAARYGFEVIGTVIPSGSTLGQPSSADLAALVEVVRAAAVPAIFAETTEPSQLAEAVAAEVGDDVAVVELFTGSLGPEGSGAETLLDMLRLDAQLIVDALS